MTFSSRYARTLAGCVALGVAILLLAPAAAPAQKRVGIDVSRFQGTIKWNQVGKTRVSFAFVQASRGSGNDCTVSSTSCGPDQFYRRNYQRAKANGIRVGPYHRAFTEGSTIEEVRRDARREARVFTNSVGSLRPRDLQPVLDLERPFASLERSPHHLRVWTRVWLRRVEQALGAKPIIYTNHSSWQYTGDVTGFARRGHALWVAHWRVPRNQILVPADNWAGRGWSVWQWTSEGRVRGIQGNVDLNRMRVPIRQLTMRVPAGGS
jgi:lysozyme